MVKHARLTKEEYLTKLEATVGELFLLDALNTYSPDEWDAFGTKARAAAYKKDKREKAKAAKKARKRAAVGKKMVNKVLDAMIFPKVVQCDTIDLEMGGSCTDGWEWTQDSVNQHVREAFLKTSYRQFQPVRTVFNDNWIPAMLCITSIPQLIVPRIQQ